MKLAHLIPEKYLIGAIQVLVGCIFIIPFVTFSDYYFPFIVPRNTAFRILVELLLIAYVLLIAQNRTYLPQKSKAFVAFLVFVSCLTLASIFGADFRNSLWSNYERMEGLITMYHLVIFVMIVFGTLRERAQWERLLQASLFVSVCMAFIGLSQMLGVNLLLASSGGERISATMGNATYLAAYLLIHLFFALYFLIKVRLLGDMSVYKYLFIGLDLLLIYLHFAYGVSDDRTGIVSQIFSHVGVWVPFVALQLIVFADFFRERISGYHKSLVIALYSIFSFLFVLIIANTQTRGALVGLGFSVIVAYLLLLFRRGARGYFKVASSVVVLCLIVGVALIFVYRDSSFVRSQPVLQKVSSISFVDATTKTRLATWRAALQGASDRPLLGWGLENFHLAFNKYFPTSIYTDEGTPLWFDRPHNILLQYLVEGGAVSLLAYLVFLTLLSISLLRTQQARHIGVLWIAMIVGYVGQNLFVFDSINSYIPFYFAVGFLFHLTSDTTNERRVATAQRPRHYVWASLVPVTIVAVLFLIGGVHARTLQTNGSFVSLYREQNNEGLTSDSVQRMFDVIDQSLYLGKAEIMGAYSEFLVNLLQAEKTPEYELNPAVEGLVQRFEEYRSHDPNDARFNMFLMNVYLNAIKSHPDYLDGVVSVADATIPLSPSRPQLYYMRGRAYMAKGRYAEGLADFKKAVELAPTIPDAHTNLFAAYASMGDSQSAQAELSIIQELVPFDSARYARYTSIYVASGLYDEAVLLLEQAKEELPEGILEFQVGIAEVQGAAGNDAAAREAMQEAVRLDRSVETYAQDFYRRLEAGELVRKK